MRACVRACVRVCVRACVCVCVRKRGSGRERGREREERERENLRKKNYLLLIATLLLGKQIASTPANTERRKPNTFKGFRPRTDFLFQKKRRPTVIAVCSLTCSGTGTMRPRRWCLWTIPPCNRTLADFENMGRISSHPVGIARMAFGPASPPP